MIRLTFLGTKGEIEEYSEKHRYHSSLLIEYRKFKILIDHGIRSGKTINQIKPNAVLVTHAHPDHYVWTKKDEKTRIPVYATRETISYGKFKPENYKIINPGKRFGLGHFSIIPGRVMHSLKCPGICFRISAGNKNIIFTGDLVDIINKNKILKNADYYIGDGSSIKANLVRKKGKKFFGHARITTQINWCRKFSIKNMIFTHLGKETIRKEKEFRKSHPDVTFAYDGMKRKITA
jgi:ribonuclease BN (tRNA processing enzyme)